MARRPLGTPHWFPRHHFAGHGLLAVGTAEDGHAVILSACTGALRGRDAKATALAGEGPWYHAAQPHSGSYCAPVVPRQALASGCGTASRGARFPTGPQKARVRVRPVGHGSNVVRQGEVHDSAPFPLRGAAHRGTPRRSGYHASVHGHRPFRVSGHLRSLPADS